MPDANSFLSSYAAGQGVDAATLKGFHLAADALEPRRRLREIGLHYQHHVYVLCMLRRAPIRVAVETGTRTGVLTRFVLSALEDRDEGGVLYSCEPLYPTQRMAEEKLEAAVGLRTFERHHWHFFPGRSAQCLSRIAAEQPDWDLFVHDSDHSRENMLFELAFAWERLRPGGLLVVDDFLGDTWLGLKPHDAFATFCEAFQIGPERVGRLGDKETVVVIR